MAGIQGQGSVKKVQAIGAPMPPPQGVDLPQEQMAQPEAIAQPVTEENPLDAIYGASASENPLDAIYGQATQAPAEAPEQGFYDKMLEGSGGITRGISHAAYGAVKGLLTLPSAVGEAVAEEVKTGKGDLGQSIINAFRPSGKTADLRESFRTFAPIGENDVSIKLPVMKANMDELDINGRPSMEWDGSSFETNVKPNDILPIVADIMAGEGAIKIVGKTGKFIASKAPLVDEMIGGWLKARTLAKEANTVKTGESIAANLTSKVDLATEHAKDMKGLVDELQQAGIVKNVEGFDVPVIPSQVALEKNAVAQEAEYLSDMPRMKEFIDQQKVGLDDSFNGIFETLVPGYARNVGPKDVKIPNLVSGALEIEGKMLDSGRQAAYREGRHIPVKTDGLRQELDNMVQELGIQSHTPTELVGRNDPTGIMGGSRRVNKLSELAILDKPEWLKSMTSKGYRQEYANSMFDELKKLDSLMTKYGDNIPYGELQSAYSKLKGNVKGLWQNTIMDGGYAYRINMTKLKSAMQSHVDEGAIKILGPEKGAALIKNSETYSSVKGAVADYAKVAETEIGAAALSNWTFQGEGSIGSVSRAKGMHTLTHSTGHPEAWDNLVSNYLHRGIKANTEKIGKHSVVKWDNVFATIDKLDPDVQQLMFGKKLNLGIGYNKSGVDAIKDIAAFYDGVVRGTPEIYKAKTVAEKIEKANAVKAIASFMVLPKTTLAKGVHKVATDAFIMADKEARLAEFFTKEGIDDVLKFVPKDKHGFVQRQVDAYVKQSRAAQKAKAGMK